VDKNFVSQQGQKSQKENANQGIESDVPGSANTPSNGLDSGINSNLLIPKGGDPQNNLSSNQNAPSQPSSTLFA